jgi:ATP/ADP translocase
MVVREFFKPGAHKHDKWSLEDSFLILNSISALLRCPFRFFFGTTVLLYKMCYIIFYVQWWSEVLKYYFITKHYIGNFMFSRNGNFLRGFLKVAFRAHYFSDRPLKRQPTYFIISNL